MKKSLLYFTVALVFYSCNRKTEQKVIYNKNIFDSLERVLITENKVTPELLWKFARITEFDVSPNGEYVVYTVKRFSVTHNKGFSDLFLTNIVNKKTFKLTSFAGNEYNPLWRPDGKKIGFISDESGEPQIWEINIDGTQPIMISKIKGGINSFKYSPKGNFILYTKDVKVKKSIVDIYPDLPLAKVYIADDLMYRHWDRWEDGAYSHIFIAERKGDSLINDIDIMKDEPYDAPLSPYFEMSEINWSPDEKYVAYTCKKLEGKNYTISTNSDIYLYNLTTKETINISADNHGYDRYPVFSNDASKIAWMRMLTPSYESDKMNIVVYDINSKTIKNYTDSFDLNAYNYIWSNDNKKIYFITEIRGTKQVYSINLENKFIKAVTNGIHDINEIVKGGNTIIASITSMKRATELFKINIEDGSLTQITNINNKIYEKVKMGEVKERWVTTTDKKKMLVWYIYPPDFDSTKKYPAILYCQGGPQSMVSQFFSFRWNFQIMAANGYIVIAPNRRGVPGFGYEWVRQISGDYAGQNMLDYLTAIDDACTLPYIDKERLACVGASYGGFSVFWLAGNHNKRFKAFIAHCGMFNLESQYASTDETFFTNFDFGGPFWDKNNKIAQRTYQNSPHKFVDKWDTPILIISGENDFRIPYTESIQAFNCARLRDVPAKLLIFPDETHFVLKPQNSILWQREFFAWLDIWLKK
ncbi:MAG: S9 family peptidase [Bacteroidales bacterium]|nr:S9 family peptidase [Bacteroidales bacterium]